MHVQMINTHTMKTEIEFDVTIDRSCVEFTERVCELRTIMKDECLSVGEWLDRTEQSMILESMRNSGMFENHSHCFVVFS